MPALKPQAAILDFPVFGQAIPDADLRQGDYTLRFVRTNSELAEIQRLRYRVFNVELSEGLDSSHELEMDIDEFDPFCHHMFVRHSKTNQIVGTYRMQSHEMALTHQGFYAETEFDLSSFPLEAIESSVEIGRACIAKEHRSLSVLYLLWKGLGRYASHNNTRYLFGCCSLTSQDEDKGADLYNFLKRKGHLHPKLSASPLPSTICCSEHNSPNSNIRPPRLMRAYLSLGAKICSPPAIDTEFKTIDFLALFDFETLRESDLAFYRFLK